MAVPDNGKHAIFDAMLKFFQEDGWTFRQIEGKPIVQMGFKGQNGSWVCYAQARDDVDRLIFYSVLDTNVPENKRVEVAEFLTRANYGLVIGNFELDFNDGEVRYKTSVDVEGGQLTPTMIKNLVYVNVIMMDKYLPGVMSVIYAGVTPAEAVTKIEQPQG